MKKILLIISIFLMAGCATKPVTQEVMIPVAKKCYDESKIKKPSRPDLLTDKWKNGDENKKTDILLNDALTDVNQLKVYAGKLEIMVCE